MKTTKNIPELRFPGFEGEWVEEQFGKKIQKVSEKYNPESDPQEFPCIELESISQNSGTLLQTFNSLELKSIKNKFQKGDILFGKLRPYLKKYYRARFDGVCSSEIWVLKGKNTINEFIYYLIQTEKFNNEVNLTIGSKMPRAEWSYISEIEFHFPSLPEQQKIASFLSAADQRIQLLTQKKEKLEQYKKGIMHQIFSQQLRFKDENGQEYPEWEEKRLGDLTDFIMNGLSLPQNNEGKGVKVTRIETISDRTINIQKVGYVETNQDITRYQLNIGDILFSNINSVAHIGKVVRIDNEYDLFHGMNLLRIKLNRNLCSTRFIYHVLNLESSKKYFEKICNKAVNQASINQTELGKTIIRTPTIPEQQKIASFLSAIDQKINYTNQQIELTRKWKQGLLQKMFV